MTEEDKKLIADAVDGLSARVAILEQQSSAQQSGGKTTLQITEVAALTGLSVSHLYKLTSTNQIPHFKPMGKRVYFDRAEIEAWMKRGRVQTAEATERTAALYNVRKQMGV